MLLGVSKKCPKWVQNGPAGGPLGPQKGPFCAYFGPFWGHHLRLLDWGFPGHSWRDFTRILVSFNPFGAL